MKRNLEMQKESEDDSIRRDGTGGLHVSSSRSMKQTKMVTDISQLPWNVLDIISKKLDFDDLFEFAGVCKSWSVFHKIYWRSFMESQAPLIVQSTSYAKKAICFISIPEQKIYRSKMDYFWGLRYTGSSSGYLIMVDVYGTLFLMNPFTRRKKTINTSAIRSKFAYTTCHVLLAFAKGSEEFVIVITCTVFYTLHVYQSRNSVWVTHSFKGDPLKVVDVVVLQNTIYVITDKANIGILNLNSINIKFLELNNTPSITVPQPNLVSCDGQLLVVCFAPEKILNVYKIDLSTKSYVKLETLGDIALFYVGRIHGRNSCYAVSKPHIWGFENNSVYFLDCFSTECRVYSGSDIKLKMYFRPTPIQTPRRSRLSWLDWCFRHLRDEVDYSLVD